MLHLRCSKLGIASSSRALNMTRPRGCEVSCVFVLSLMPLSPCQAYPSPCICDLLTSSYHTQAAAHPQSIFDSSTIPRPSSPRTSLFQSLSVHYLPSPETFDENRLFTNSLFSLVSKACRPSAYHITGIIDLYCSTQTHV